MKVASTFRTGKTDAAKLLTATESTSFSPSSLLLPTPASAPEGNADADVLPLGCGCQCTAQLLLLPPWWEDGEGEGKEEESYLLQLLHKLSGRIVRAVMKSRVRLREFHWKKMPVRGKYFDRTQTPNFTWLLWFLQANEENSYLQICYLFCIVLSQQLRYFSSCSCS